MTIGLSVGQTLDLESVYDLDPEFAIEPATGGAVYSVVLDSQQEPVLISQDGSSYTFRYWTVGSYDSGTMSVTFIADSFTRADGSANIAYTTTVVDPTTVDVGYMDVNYTPTSGYVLDVDSIVDVPHEFELKRDIDGDGVTDVITEVVQSTSYAPLRLTNSNTFRYFLEGDFSAGQVEVSFAAESFQSVAVDEAGIEATGGIKNLAKIESFTVQELTADLVDPLGGSTIDSNLLNNRGFIDVDFVVPTYAELLDIDSVTDLDPEFTVTVNTGGTLVLDNGQAPVLVNQDGDTYTFRYWYVGTFTDGDIDINFIGNSLQYISFDGELIGNFADETVTVQDDEGTLFVVVEFGESLTLNTGTVGVEDLSGEFVDDEVPVTVSLANMTERGPPGSYRIDVTAADLAVGDDIIISYTGNWTYNGVAAVIENTRNITVAPGESLTYIDVRFNTAGDIELDTDTIDGDEFNINGTGKGTASIATAIDYQPTRLGDSDVFRYYLNRGFVAGSLAVTYVAGSWLDEAGNTGSQETETFQIIEALQDDSQLAQPSGKIFFIEISGGIKLKGLGFLDEPIIDIRGKVTLEIGKFILPNGNNVFRFAIDASGTIKIIKLGNIGSVAARFILQVGNTMSGLPEFWGVAKIQANLDFMKNFGIFAEGSALLQINMTGSVKTEKISLEGIPGDPVAENLVLSTASLSGSILGEVELPGEWTSSLSGLDVDPDTAGLQTMNLAGAMVQTIIVGQKWKIITADGPVFFLQYDSSDGKVDLSTEFQTFELPALSFSIEIIGSMRLKANGSSDEAADDWVIMTGGFFLRITPTRFEVFVMAYAAIPILGLAGQATGLFIIDARFTGPGIRGLHLCSISSLTSARRRIRRLMTAVRSAILMMAAEVRSSD